MSGEAANVELFDARIVEVPRVRWGTKVQNSANDARLVHSLPNHELWIGKQGTNVSLAESVAWLIGARVGVRSPNAAVHRLPDASVAWMSQFVSNCSGWQRAYTDIIANPDEIGAMLAMDAILMNPCRHEADVLAQPIHGGAARMIWAIDFANAGFVRTDRAGALANTDFVWTDWIRDFPYVDFRLRALKAAERFQDLSSKDIALDVHRAVEVAGEGDPSAIIAFLSVRQPRSCEVVERHLRSLIAAT